MRGVLAVPKERLDALGAGRERRVSAQGATPMRRDKRKRAKRKRAK